jgi:MinD-like ATPase involved in chromosome partitioning or flagellar assembly
MSDGQLVVRSNNEGVPFILANPSAPISQDLMRVAQELIGSPRVPVGAGRG